MKAHRESCPWRYYAPVVGGEGNKEYILPVHPWSSGENQTKKIRTTQHTKDFHENEKIGCA